MLQPTVKLKIEDRTKMHIPNARPSGPNANRQRGSPMFPVLDEVKIGKYVCAGTFIRNIVVRPMARKHVRTRP